MHLRRIFSSSEYKGTRNYLATQKKYEIIRTVLYFGISISLFVSGMLLVKSRLNLLTLVAVLGCLPASKSAVSMIMFLRYPSLNSDAASQISQSCGGLQGLYDLVFTSYDKNYRVGHMTVRGNTLCGYTEDPSFDEKGFASHIDGLLKAEQLKDVNVKIFTDLNKYLKRLEQLGQADVDGTNTDKILAALKSVSL